MEIKRGAFTKLLISQLLSAIECQTWFLINAKQITYEDVGACGRGTHQAKS